MLGDFIHRTWIYAHNILNGVVARLRIGVPFEIDQSSRDARVRVAGKGGESAIQSVRRIGKSPERLIRPSSLLKQEPVMRIEFGRSLKIAYTLLPVALPTSDETG